MNRGRATLGYRFKFCKLERRAKIETQNFLVSRRNEKGKGGNTRPEGEKKLCFGTSLLQAISEPNNLQASVDEKGDEKRVTRQKGAVVPGNRGTFSGGPSLGGMMGRTMGDFLESLRRGKASGNERPWSGGFGKKKRGGRKIQEKRRL